VSPFGGQPYVLDVSVPGYVGCLCRNSTLRKCNLKCDFTGCFDLVLMAMAHPQVNVACVSQCRMLRTLLEATGCRCRASIFAVSPRRLPWSSMLVDVQSHTKHNFLASVPNEKMDRPIDFFGKCTNNSDLVNTSIE
jgi:hypothetical protein